MATHSGISWTHHSISPWIGCEHRRPACDHCWAEQIMDRRLHRVQWGHGQPRIPMAESGWAHIQQWNRAALRAGERRRVFWWHLADICDPSAPPGLLERAWDEMDRARQLDHILRQRVRGAVWRMTRRRPTRPPDWPMLVRVVRELPEHGCTVAVGPITPWGGPDYDEAQERARLARVAERLLARRRGRADSTQVEEATQ